MSVVFGGRRPGSRSSLPGFPGIVQEQTPGGLVYRVMSPTYIPHVYNSAEEAREARYKASGLYNRKRKGGPKMDHPMAYITQLSQNKWRVNIDRADVKLDKTFRTHAEAAAARDDALRAAGLTPPLNEDDFAALDAFLEAGGFDDEFLGAPPAEDLSLDDKMSEAHDWLFDSHPI